MVGSEKVRAARKKGQLARLEAKEKATGNEYAVWFAKLPKQVAKAAVNEQIHLAKQGLNDAAEALQIAEETGENLLAAQENAQVAALFVNKLEAAKQMPTTMRLTAAKGVA